MSGWLCRWRRLEGWLAVMLLLGGCASRPPEPTPTESLLELASRVILATTVEERRSIEAAERRSFDAEPSHDNLMRLTVVRAFGAALPADLMEARADLQALANGRHELAPSQRQLAQLLLVMVDERLRMGSQITDLQKQIDSLTEIETTLNHSEVMEQLP